MSRKQKPDEAASRLKNKGNFLERVKSAVGALGRPLPESESVLRHLLGVAQTFLDFVEPVVQNLRREQEIIESAQAGKGLDLRLFRQISDALRQRLLHGGPAYDSSLPYLGITKAQQFCCEITRLKENLRNVALDEIAGNGILWQIIRVRLSEAEEAFDEVQRFQARIIQKLEIITVGAGQQATPNRTKRQWDALQATSELKAFGPECRVTAAQIAHRAEGCGGADAFKRPLSSLVKKGLLVSTGKRGGPAGGYWLSPRGLELISTHHTP